MSDPIRRVIDCAAEVEVITETEELAALAELARLRAANEKWEGVYDRLSTRCEGLESRAEAAERELATRRTEVKMWHAAAVKAEARVAEVERERDDLRKIVRALRPSLADALDGVAAEERASEPGHRGSPANAAGSNADLSTLSEPVPAPASPAAEERPCAKCGGEGRIAPNSPWFNADQNASMAKPCSACAPKEEPR